MTDDEFGDAFAEWADEALDWSRAYVSDLWSEDWDSPEDTAAYG